MPSPPQDINPYAVGSLPRQGKETELLAGPLAADGQRPTKVRYGVVALAIAMAVLLYLHRFALTPVTSQVMTDFDMTKPTFGWVGSIFFLTYALSQVPAGGLSDRFGARITLTLMVLFWSLATIGMGWVGGFLGLMIMRGLLGIAQAGAYPTAASLVKRWLPYSARGRASAAIAMGGRLGFLLAVGLTPFFVSLSERFQGGQESGAWRAIFVAYGLLGFIWCGLFYYYFRETPANHPWCNLAERNLIAGEAAGATAGAGKVASQGFSPLALLSPNLWLIAAINLLVNVAWVFLAVWITTYLDSKLGKESLGLEIGGRMWEKKQLSGLLSAMTAVGGLIGSLMGGFLTDYCARHYGPIWGRRIPGILASGIAGSLYLVCSQVDSVWLLIPIFFAISLTIDLALGATWATCQDIGGTQVAVVLGIANMCGNLGAFGCGKLIGNWAENGNWATVFFVSAASLGLTLLCWLAINPTKPVMSEDLTGG